MNPPNWQKFAELLTEDERIEMDELTNTQQIAAQYAMMARIKEAKFVRKIGPIKAQVFTENVQKQMQLQQAQAMQQGQQFGQIKLNGGRPGIG